MKDLISVVVPIYNVEKYIENCIKSIINQTYDNLEIILVDDGSKDNCGKICDEYATKDNRIKVMHKENGGLSDARNCGLEISNGKYVIFIDSDDWIEKNMIELLYSNIIKANADISICEFVEEDEQGKVVSQKIYDNETVVFDSEGAIKDLIIQKTLTNHAWNKLYSKKIFNNVRYPKGQLMEDISTTYKLFENSKKIIYQNTALYHYLQRSKSILGNITRRRIDDQDKAINERNEYLQNKYPQLIKEIEIDNLKNVKTLYYLAIIGNYKDMYNSNKYKEYYKVAKEYYKKNQENIDDKDKLSLKLFYTNKELYKIYVKLKTKLKG